MNRIIETNDESLIKQYQSLIETIKSSLQSKEQELEKFKSHPESFGGLYESYELAIQSDKTHIETLEKNIIELTDTSLERVLKNINFIDDVLEKQIISQMELKIELVLSGQLDSAKMIGIRPDHVRNYLEKKYKIEIDTDFDTNGWSWDYWIHIELNGIKYSLNGDGFYNLSCNFRKAA